MEKEYTAERTTYLGRKITWYNRKQLADIVVKLLNTMEENNNVKEPELPLERILIEGTGVGDCPVCKSTTIKRFFMFGRSIGCVNPLCDNYYNKYHDR